MWVSPKASYDRLQCFGGCKLQVAGCKLELQVIVSPLLKQPETSLMLTLGLKIMFKPKVSIFVKVWAVSVIW